MAYTDLCFGQSRWFKLKQVVIFDGVCHLCNGSVQFILKHESGPALMFAPLQSSTGARLLRELGFDPKDVTTFVLIDRDEVFVRSSAAIRLATYLRWPWCLLRYCVVVPRPIRDWVYNTIARNRYRWFGRSTACMVPSAGLKHRFIVD
ncbi:thiol-disulfide oxidoreductase DCC family protein [Limnobacter sp.]|uniref:thiol-disulfide oxidoreductase DCC family protein n=1 Tax=Limnobacter sp. TaxID=2003368 RepID=UPI00391BC4BA